MDTIKKKEIDELISNNQKTPTVVRNIQQIRDLQGERWIQQDEALKKSLALNISLSEFVKGVRDEIKRTYTAASAFIITSNKINDEFANIHFEHTGNESILEDAICESMHMSNAVFNLFNNAILKFVKNSKKSEAERAITSLQDTIKELETKIDPIKRTTMIEAEIKRLRKSGRSDLIPAKLDELKKIQDEKERKKANRQKRIENLVKARAALALKREQQKKSQQQQNQHPQPNFAKMAKKKRQQIAARQAEKKKKKASSTGDSNVRSCSQLLG